MSAIDSAVLRFRREPNPLGAQDNPFKLRSSLSEAASADEITLALGESVPVEVAALWSRCRSARLFEDIDYGQWGLQILDPAASAARNQKEIEARPLDFRGDDIVLGTFLGDQDLLVIAPSEGERRRVMVALPLDGRADWFGVAASLAEFLETYFAARGNKYWERAGKVQIPSPR
jgi:hypothetical protein